VALTLPTVEPAERAREDPAQRTARLSDSAILSITAEGKLLNRLHEAIEGTYQLRGALGQGGMGTVYLAHDLALDRPVAIKVMLPELAPDVSTVERFRREARTVASLHHPNIIPVYGVHESDDLAYFVMRYVEGRTLDSILRHHGALPLEVARSILRQVGSGLQHAHHRGVIHRDVKPANIMIDQDGWALIADFGIAKVRGAHNLTRTGATIGTPSYMSPEQCSDLEITSASDQYALGIVAYELLTGRPPFRGENVAAVVKKHLFDTPLPLEELLPECPPETARAIRRMLAKSPGLRWPSVDEAVRQIGGRLDAASDLSRKQIAAVAKHGEEVPVTWLDPDSLERTSAPVAATRRLDAATRRRSPWLYRIGGGSVGTAAVAVLALFLQGDPVGAASPTDTASAGNPAVLLQPGAMTLPVYAGTEPASSDSAAMPTRTGASAPRTVAAGRAPREATPPVAADPRPAEAAAGPDDTNTAEPPATGPGSVLLGTRGHPAVLYANGAVQGAASRLIAWPIPAGEVTLSLRMEGCAPWDSTVVVQPGEQLRIGYRSPVCGG